jgi:hypothetical protein
MKETDKYELFENYLKGKFSAAEKAEIENLLRADAEIQTQFEEYQSVHQLIMESSLLDMKKQLADIHNETLRTIRIKRNIQYAVISAILITTAVLYFVLNKRNGSSQKPGYIVPINPIVTHNQSNVSTGSQVKPNAKPFFSTSSTISEKLVKHDNGLPARDTVSKVTITMPASVLEKQEQKEEQQSVLCNPDTKPLEVNPNFGEQKNVPASKTTDCSNAQITCTYRTEEGCEDSGQGKIIFNKSSIKGGKAPYMFSINDGQFEHSVVFEQLITGRYKLMVKDDDDCQSVIGFADVKEIICPADFVIAPDRAEYLAIPYEKGQLGKLFIYTKNGNLVYSADIDHSFYTYWDGKASDGKELSLGVYVFHINYSNGKVLNGSVTIVK